MVRTCGVAVAADLRRLGDPPRDRPRLDALLAEAPRAAASDGCGAARDLDPAGAIRLAAARRHGRCHRQAQPRRLRAYQRRAATFGDGCRGLRRARTALCLRLVVLELGAARRDQEALCAAEQACRARRSGARLLGAGQSLAAILAVAQDCLFINKTATTE